MNISDIIAGRKVTRTVTVACDYMEDADHIADLLRSACAKDVNVVSPRTGVYEVRFIVGEE